ncbi:MAG: TetR/AcrR family transcriptional regulator [Candidatus Gracilibacteria bacterium]|nr:TetR/AcrR family transcriptional regulator [Candidatus Gracilibacteria bacterium]
MKKQELLQKIELLFYSKTFKEVSMQDIANELGMKKASVYYHFPSKEQMVLEVLDYSFNNYLTFINILINKGEENINNKQNLVKLISDFISYPETSKNLFSIINQNGYCENEEILKIIEAKQKIIFENISKKFTELLGFSNEKTFLFMSLMHDIWRKKCIYGNCEIKVEKLISEIYDLFFN